MSKERQELAEEEIEEGNYYLITVEIAGGDPYNTRPVRRSYKVHAANIWNAGEAAVDQAYFDYLDVRSVHVTDARATLLEN